MNPIKTTLSEDARSLVIESMQSSLNELLDLSLTAKQAHWNVIGAGFRPVHLQLDEMVAQYRAWADEVAERRVALGAPADGRAATVAAATSLPSVEPDWMNQSRVIGTLTERLHEVITRFRERSKALDPVDPVSQDLVNGIIMGLEQQSWMLQAQQS